MIEIYAEPARQVLTFKFSGQVSAEEMQAKVDVLRRELARLESGFVAFTDLTGLERMENEATDQIAAYMDLCTAKGVGRIVRLIPKPERDIGFELLSVFHHDKGIRTITCSDVEDARRALED